MDRRSFISAAVVASAAAVVSPAFAAPASQFELKLAAWRTERAIFANGYIPDDVANAAISRIDQAFGDLLNTPSRDMRDIATKLDAMVIEYDGCEFDSDRVRIIAADARRLSGGEV